MLKRGYRSQVPFGPYDAAIDSISRSRRLLAIGANAPVGVRGDLRRMGVVMAVAALAGCGAETATTAATGAAIKKQEVEQAKQTEALARQKLEQATEHAQQRPKESYP